MPATSALAGYTVAELGSGAAAMAGRVLASLGARVVHIRPPGGDRYDFDPRFPISPRAAWYGLDKEMVTLDLSTTEGVATLRDALATTDLLIEGHRPGQMAAWGLDPARLRRDFPRLVILSLSDYGQDGPYRDLPGSALTTYAYGGSLFRAGRPTDPPLPPPVDLADTIGGVLGALAAVTALVGRGADGEGDWIDCSVAEACLSVSDWSIPMRSMAGVNVVRDGSGPLYAVYPTADGWVRMINLSPRQWQAFLDWLGRPEELSGPEWQAVLYRLANADLMNAIFLREKGEHATREQLMYEAQAARVSLVPVYAPEEIGRDRHFAARQSLAEVEIDGLGTISVPRAFARFGAEIPPTPRWRKDEVPPSSVFRPHPSSPPSGRGVDFSRLKVVEIGAGGVAPEAARYLALLGADVIKVELPEAMDFLRTLAGPGLHEYSPAFASSNRNKRSIRLDLKHDADRATLHRLLRVADVLLENNSGGVCDRLGAGYEAVSAINPRIIYASAQLLGATGPAAHAAGFGPSNQAVSGISHLWSHPDNPKPEGVSLVHPDHLAGRMLAVAVLAALGERERTGKGVRIDMAQAEFAMASIGEAFVEASLLGVSARRGNDHPAYVPHGIFPSMVPEQWLAIAVETDAQWAALCQALGNPEWAVDPAYATAAGRVAARAAINAGLTTWTQAMPRAMAVRLLQRAGVPAMPVLSPVEQLADAHFNARGAFDLVDHAALGWGRYEGSPFRFQHRRLLPSTPAPFLGEHTEQVIADWLGIPVPGRG